MCEGPEIDDNESIHNTMNVIAQFNYLSVGLVMYCGLLKGFAGICSKVLTEIN